MLWKKLIEGKVGRKSEDHWFGQDPILYYFLYETRITGIYLGQVSSLLGDVRHGTWDIIGRAQLSIIKAVCSDITDIWSPCNFAQIVFIPKPDLFADINTNSTNFGSTAVDQTDVKEHSSTLISKPFAESRHGRKSDLNRPMHFPRKLRYFSPVIRFLSPIDFTIEEEGVSSKSKSALKTRLGLRERNPN